MRILLHIFVLLASTSLYAQVELQSVYFNGNSDTPTQYSNERLAELKTRLSNGRIQIVEINGYTSTQFGRDVSIELARKRINSIFETLKTDSTNATINPYGNQHIAVSFTPVNWNRVDIYYTILERPAGPTVITKASPVEEVPQAPVVETPIDPLPESKDEMPSLDEMPNYEDIILNNPILLPISFEGGKDEIKSGSKETLELLAKILVTYEDINVHIKGHVCCGNNVRISKKRARYVYKYLRQQGISKDRLSYKGYSNSEPLVSPERTAADRSKNRRVDIIFSKKQ